jgi:predicted AAA+ superfamily ATPase
VPAAAETPVADDLLSIILAGGYPEVLARSSERRRRDWCRAYVDAITERDIREIADVERLGQIPRLLDVLAQFSGQLVNLSGIGGQLGLSHKTADRYISILEQLFLVRRLQPWFSNALKRLVKTPKVHFLDSGLLAVLCGHTRAKLHADRRPFGPLLESFAYAELLKQASWAEERVRLFHFRDKDQAEVDFVLEDEAGRVVGVEVKAAATVGASDFRGLDRLSAATGRKFALGVVLYDGEEILPFGSRMAAAPMACLWS